MPDAAAPSKDSGSPLLAVVGLSLRRGGRTLVRDLHLTLGAGERLVIVGGNGAGKSTLLAALAGLLPPDEGRITRPTEPPGMQFQDGALWPHMTVAQHLAFAAPTGSVEWQRRLLDTFGLAALARHRPEQLSGGERTRLGLARALAGRSRWILLDEPLAHLDPEGIGLVRERLPLLLDELGAASIAVSHDPDDVLLFGQTLLLLTGRGSWWLGETRFVLDAPPTPELAILSGRGTLLVGQADGTGRADLGLGLVLEGCPPGARARGFLDAAAVRLLPAGEGPLQGVFLAPDRRGGSWVRVHGRLLRARDGRGGLAPGAPLGLSIEGQARRLQDGTLP